MGFVVIERQINLNFAVSCVRNPRAMVACNTLSGSNIQKQKATFERKSPKFLHRKRRNISYNQYNEKQNQISKSEYCLKSSVGSGSELSGKVKLMLTTENAVQLRSPYFCPNLCSEKQPS